MMSVVTSISDAVDTGNATYRWKGPAQRALNAGSGLILVGVRFHNSVTGSFTSIDLVPGGNTTAYAYPQDLINQYDLSGK